MKAARAQGIGAVPLNQCSNVAKGSCQQVRGRAGAVGGTVRPAPYNFLRA